MCSCAREDFVQLKDANKDEGAPAPKREVGNLFPPEWCQNPRPGRERMRTGTPRGLGTGNRNMRAQYCQTMNHTLISHFFLLLYLCLSLSLSRSLSLSLCQHTHINMYTPLALATRFFWKVFDRFREGKQNGETEPVLDGPFGFLDKGFPRWLQTVWQ